MNRHLSDERLTQNAPLGSRCTVQSSNVYTQARLKVAFGSWQSETENREKLTCTRTSRGDLSVIWAYRNFSAKTVQLQSPLIN